MVGHDVERRPDSEKGVECMESLGNDDLSSKIVVDMKKLQSQSQSQDPEESEMGETESEVVRENSVVVSKSRSSADAASELGFEGGNSVVVSNSSRHGNKNGSSREGHVCRFCSRVFSSGRALGGHVRVHGAGRSNGQSSSSVYVSRGDYSSTDIWVKESKVPTGRSYGNSNWDRAGSIEEGEDGEEEEEDQKVVKNKNKDVGKEELDDDKMVPLYTLRKNPKRSRRLTDLQFGMDLTTKNSTAWYECGKEFRSSKALFSHIGCHPERAWKGIQPPDDSTYGSDDNNQENTNGGASIDDATAAPSSGLPPSCWQSSQGSEDLDDKGEEDAAGSDNESDRVGMKAGKAAHGPVSCSFLTWSVTSKRGRRVPNRSKPLQQDYAEEEETEVDNIKELEDDTDTAHFLVMLASSASNTNKTNKANRPVERQMTKESVHYAKTGKGESQGSSEDLEPGQEEKRTDKTSRPTELGADKYKCRTCKKLFNSHQALGGHRASHRNIRCCTAITDINGVEREMAEDDIGITEVGSSVLMTEYHPAAMDGMDSSPAREEEEKRANHSHLTQQRSLNQAIPMKKGKGHECCVCNKVFPSGQALGGHKRCHWTVDRVETATSAISTKKQPKQGHMRTVPKPVFDLNEPAPMEEEDLEASYGIIEMGPAFDESVNDKVKMVDDVVSNAGFRYVCML